MREQIVVCYGCRKIFALLEDSNRISCPRCGSEMEATGIDVEKWKQMSRDERSIIIDKGCGQGKEKREIDEIVYEGADNDVDRSRKKMQKSKDNSTLFSIAIFIAALLVAGAVILVIRIKLNGSVNRSVDDYALEEASDTKRSALARESKSSETKKAASSSEKNSGEITNIVRENDVDKTANAVESEKALYDCIINESNGDDIVDTIVEDSNGDGIQDMIAEAGKTVGDEWLRYFIFTDGKNTYRFGEYSNSVFYGSQNYILTIGNEKHLINSSRWRPTALGGSMSHTSIFRLGVDSAHTIFDEDFVAATGIDDGKDIVYVSYHQKADPGEKEQSRGVLYDDGDKISIFYSHPGVSSEYAFSDIPPKSSPESIWSGTNVQEVIGNYGIHFYVPIEWTLDAEEYEVNNEMIFYAVVDGERVGWILSTSCYVYEGTSEPFDWGIGQWVYKIGDREDEHFYICAAAEDNLEDDPKLNPNIYFPELEQYIDAIFETAWVE